MIKKRFLTILSAMVVLFCYSAAVSAQTPGYALYGDVPTGYTDLTSKVQVFAPAVITGGQNLASTDHAAPAAEGIAFTGRGHSSHYCQGSADLSIRFSEDQSLTLTENYAIHIKIKRTNAGSGDIQMSFIKSTWGSVRVGFLMDASKLSDTESEVVLKYADRKQNGGGQYYCNGENQTYGTRTFNGGNGTEIFRMTAANGESFLITGIYLEATYTEPTPGPGPEPEPDPDPEFEAPVAVDGTGYLLYGATAPCGYEDLKSSVAYSAKGSLALNDAAGLKITGAGLPGRICETSNYLQMSFSAQQSLTLDENFSLHIVIAKSSSATGDVQISFCRNGWNSTRIAYTIANSAIGTEPTDIELKYTARNTGNWNSYGESAALGSPATFPAAEILRLCATAGEEFTITGLYLQTSATPCFTPDPSDETAPTGLTAAVKAGSVSYNEATLTLSAEDESAPITFNIWNADKTAKVATASAASDVAKDVTLNGLTPETSYTYYVQAVDNAGNATEEINWVEVSFTTTKLSEKRYYFFRGGDLPENTADLTCVDLRKGQGTNITLGNNATLTEKMYWTKIVTSNSWWSFNQNLSAAQDMSDVNYTEWYLKVKFRTNITYNDFNIRLLEQICWQVSQHNLDITTDGEWNELTLSLSDAKGSHPAFGSFGAGKTILQFNSNCTSGRFVDIEYAYLTNNQDAEDGYADHTAPTNFTAVAGTVTSTTAELLLQATDDSGEDVEYVITSGLDTWNVTGASGVQISKTITDLTEASYTFSVVAKDHAGNAVATPIEVEVTMQAEDVTAPADLTVTQGEVTLHSIELLLQATDENGMDIIYDITMDGELLASPVGASEQQISYVVSGLEIGSVHNFSVVARDLDGNTSEAVELNDVATTSLKASAFSIFAKTLDMYNYNDHKAGEVYKTTMTLHMVEYKNKLYFAQLGDGKGLSNGTWDNQVWIWNAAETARDQELAAQVLSRNQIIRYTESGINLNNKVGQEFRFNMYAKGVFGFNDALNSQMQHFVRGYVNTPSTDNVAPSVFGDVVVTDDVVTGKRTLTISLFGEQSQWDVFYYVKEGENEYISLAKEVEVPFLKTEATYECYVIDWNGNMSAAKQVVHAPKAVISDGNEQQNAAMAAFYDGVTVDVELTRNLSSAYYNTICLPFSMSAAQVEAAFGAGCVISELTQAYIKTNNELYLGFTDVDEIEAGKPYLIQPAANVSGAKTIENVTFSKELNSSEFSSVVGFYGVVDTKTLPGDNTYIMLVANNQLAFPNSEGSIRPLRAYFRMLGATPAKVRSARIGQATQTPTDILEGEQAATTAKMIRNGQLIIVRDNKEYNVMGQIMQ